MEIAFDSDRPSSGDPFLVAGIASLEAANAMSIDNLNWLSQWYLAQCNGDWEHTDGVKIETLDNPGWWIRIDLAGTSMEGRAFARMERGHPSNDLEEWQLTGSWWVAQVKGDTFDVACGPLDLAAALGVFRHWVEASS